MIYSQGNGVIFYEGRNLNTTVSRRNFNKILNLELLSSISPDRDVLFLLSDEDRKREVRQFHCQGDYLALESPKTSIDLPDDSIIEMCCIRDGRSLLFVTEDRLVACNTRTGKQKWSVTDQPDLKEELDISAITTDAQGHVFVCDTNNECVLVFSDNSGKHLGILLKKEDGEIGVPHKIGWNHKFGLLVVTHKQDSRFMVSTYRLQ